MTMPLEFSIAEGYEISAGLDRMDPVAIHAYLTNGIAVGTAVASRPPHRSVREALPHTALAASRANVKRCQVRMALSSGFCEFFSDSSRSRS